MRHCLLSHVGDRECFSGSCLAVSKKRDNALLKESGEKGFDLELIHMCGGLLVPVSVVKHEFVVLDVLGDAVDFDFRLMHLNAWVEAANCVYLAQHDLFFEQGSFTHADANIHLIRTDMLQGPTNERSLLLDHFVIIKVAHFACRLVRSFLIALLGL